MTQISGLAIVDNGNTRNKLLAVAITVGAAIGLSMLSFFIATASAAPDKFVTNSTTLDACGFFSGVETPRNSRTYTNDGTTYTETKGTWSGVSNTYAGPVASLGEVKGAYTKVTSEENGVLTGTESFTSNAGKVEQRFSYSVPSYSNFSVSVAATKELSFLTSDTNGECYDQTNYPRP